jgi:hypothetical protein
MSKKETTDELTPAEVIQVVGRTGLTGRNGQRAHHNKECEGSSAG